MKANTNAVREEACDYLQRKWPPIKLKPRSKKPALESHNASTITWDNVDKLTTDDNIGVQFAESADLRDLDLDYQTAADLAKEVGLTDATTGFGRKSVGVGHLLYKAPDCEVKKFELPDDSYPNRLPLHDGNPSRLVLEIRGADNTYTMFPPSIHPETGETLEWNGSRREPLEITAGELRTLAGQHAVAAAALYFYPESASARFNVRMALSGALIQSGMKGDKVAMYVQAVARLGGDPKWEEDFVKNTGKRLKGGKKATGLPKLVETLQLSKACERVFRGWLQISNGPVRDDENVAKLNESYALVIVGDKTAILKLAADGGIKFLTHSAFELWHANRFIYYQDKNGDQKKISLAKYWLRHPQRRQYEGIVFAPGREVPNHFNLWRGLAVQPQPGDCSKFLAHLKGNVCRGVDDLFLWVVAWFAQIMQHPDKKIGTSLVLRGKQGTGKTIVGRIFGSLLGDHYALVSDPRYVTGRFNSHLVSCLLLHCDESFWAGDHAAEGKLKDLITGDHHFIEYKGKEPIRVNNYVRLFVTGNPDWLVPAGFEERRFAVLDVGEDHMQDIPYFAAIENEMENGGREALLDHLLRFDLKSVDLRTIPTTAALLEQKLSSLDPERGWWLDTLGRGELPWGLDEFGKCPAGRLFDRYVKHASRHGARRRSIETQLGFFLRKHVPGLSKTLGTYKYWTGTEMQDTQGMVYAFPALTECREAFAKLLQQKVTWAEKATWSPEPVPDPEPRGMP